ncbi:MAG: hypothetical protein ACYSYU_08835, partial [Planctomycetota bacterium]
MARIRLNWFVAIIILIALCVLTASAFALRKWQRNRLAYAARENGLKAYENNNWLEAAKNLGRYISIDQANPDILFKYADAQLNI